MNRAQGIREPADLRGKRVGIPEWAQTATVYTRGFLAHDFGVPLADVEWVQAGINEKGRVEKVDLNLPLGVRITRVADRSLSEMLDTGEIAGLIGATVPDCFGTNPDVVRLFPDYLEQETTSPMASMRTARHWSCFCAMPMSKALHRGM